MAQGNMEIRPIGVDGVLVRFGRDLTEAAVQRAMAFRDRVAGLDLPGVIEIAPALVSVRIGFDPARTSRKALVAALQMAELGADTNTGPTRRWDIPTAFGPDHAPQLAEVAELAGLTPDQAVEEIAAQTVRVMAIGFAPGQPYLGLLPDHWDIPRQTALTDHMPRGALVTAVRQLIIFAADAPTGWRHIGQTGFSVYRPEATNPFPLAPGDALRFCPVSDSEFATLRDSGDPNGGARCVMLT